MNPAAELVGASVTLGGRAALREASLAVAAGEIVGVVGANGAGKTTLLRAVLGLARLDAGAARLGGRLVGELTELQRAGLAGYLPQERRVAWNMPAWRIASLGAASRAPRDARGLALAALEEMGLAELAERGVRDMSGGERARVLIARLFATQAPLLVADEPTAGLDPDASLRIMDALRQRAAQGAAVLATLHDLTLAARGCDRLAVMSAGRVIALGTPAAALSAMVLGEAFALEGGLVDTPAGRVVAARRAPQVPERTGL
ncbi:MAG TPA: ABC transporter ATP-binding protein [Caulobacteraceae bacterium]|jgi:iron complex transport system ATP-binding protein